MPDGIHVATNGIVFNGKGEVLLQRRADNDWWGLPGGHVDAGESVEQGAIREVLEETGLLTRVKRLVGIYSHPDNYTIMGYPNGHLAHFVTLAFECEVESGSLVISEESTDIGYFGTGDLPENTLLGHRIRIRDAVERHLGPFVR